MPAQVHMHLHSLCKAGWPPIVTVGFGGAQGVPVAGTHGAWVNTPLAAAVAAMTAGLFGDLHIPNVGMFTTGT